MSRVLHGEDDSDCRLELRLADEAATARLGAALAATLETGLYIELEGGLGAGKTTLVRAVLRALNFAGNVKSPTYTLIEPYTVSRLNLYHFDFYRFNHADEFLEAGLEEYFSGAGVCMVEWPEKARPHLPAPDLRIELQLAGPGRQAVLSGLSKRGRRCVNSIAADWTERH